MSTRESFKNDVDIMPDDVFTVLQSIWKIARERNINSRIDHFWSDENQMHLSKVISDYEKGVTKPVYKTMDELEAYE
ncbi:MAG: hypothetical protein LBL80_06190 [Ruminococcus sp.]|jgi:hypothetical protein|nr:hypothetical protein [Ruminococcus sp.]